MPIKTLPQKEKNSDQQKIDLLKLYVLIFFRISISVLSIKNEYRELNVLKVLQGKQINPI